MLCQGREQYDNVAEWLRRWIANPLLYERVSSNLTVVVILLIAYAQKGYYNLLKSLPSIPTEAEPVVFLLFIFGQCHALATASQQPTINVKLFDDCWIIFDCRTKLPPPIQIDRL
jgi:hypothetical protein